MKKPIIGLVVKHKDISKKRTLTYICDEIKDAVFANSGIAMGIVPSVKKITLVNNENEFEIYSRLDNLLTKQEKEDMIYQIKSCDGVILSGGTESDAYELWIANYCYKNDIPIIGICAGANNIVRAVGGRTKAIENPDFHRQPEDYVHNVIINKDSQFFNFVKKCKFKVNSRHRNTIANPACLSVSGYDDEGHIEVTEDKTKKCYLGIRFHPESLYLIDKIHNQIFKEFIKICKKK